MPLTLLTQAELCLWTSILYNGAKSYAIYSIYPHTCCLKYVTVSTIMEKTKIRFQLEGNNLISVIGDQQAACLGHLLKENEIKCTYGTGCFLMVNTGNRIVQSKHGLLTTPCYKLSDNQAPVYALEGSIEMGGSMIEWAKSNLNLFKDLKEFQTLLESVNNSSGVYCVPSFSGLYAPYWDMTATGLFIGLTASVRRAHMVRAIVDGMCLRVRDTVIAMGGDLQNTIHSMKVDGGVTVNDFIMQIQADYAYVAIKRKQIAEITALGGCIAAGLGAGVWRNLNELEGIVSNRNEIAPRNTDNKEMLAYWEKAKSKARNWSQ